MNSKGKAVCVLAASVGIFILHSVLFPAAARPQGSAAKTVLKFRCWTSRS